MTELQTQAEVEPRPPTFDCLRCGHSWEPRKPERPLRCGSCKSPYWDKARPEARLSLGRRKK